MAYNAWQTAWTQFTGYPHDRIRRGGRFSAGRPPPSLGRALAASVAEAGAAACRARARLRGRLSRRARLALRLGVLADRLLHGRCDPQVDTRQLQDLVARPHL